MSLQEAKRTQTSFLRWAGSKKQIIPKLRNYWGNGFTRYIEPVAGSASLFFTIEPKEAILGDLNPELIETLRAVKNSPHDLWKVLRAFKRGKATYYTIRQQDPDHLRSLDRAARFIYLNRFCFNGLYRTNQQGKFNVPYGGSKTGDLPSVDMLERCSDLLKNASLIHGDFEEVLIRARPGDFVYEVALVKRNIAGFIQSRGRSTELIISNSRPRRLPD